MITHHMYSIDLYMYIHVAVLMGLTSQCTQAINEALDGTSAPVQVVSGYLGRVTISIPWSSLMNDSCKVEVAGLTLSVMPRVTFSSGEDLSESQES